MLLGGVVTNWFDFLMTDLSVFLSVCLSTIKKKQRLRSILIIITIVFNQ